jgi:two-component system, OmpR family, response regulator
MNPESPPKRILVVEDDAPLRSLLELLLRDAGLSVTGVGTGGEALRQLACSRFDLALLDIGLPDMSGLDVLARMPRGGGTRAVVMTADQTPETLLRAVREHAYQYIRKPFHPDAFLAFVWECLAAPEDPPIEVLSASPEWVELLVPCTRSAAERIHAFMRQMDVSLSDEVRDSVGQAFRELLLNAVEWGGRLDPGRKVRIAYLRARRMLQYRIADPGPGFRFEGLEHAGCTNPADDPIRHHQVREERGLRPGGLGIMIARSLADELLYNEAQNEVLLVKYLD